MMKNGVEPEYFKDRRNMEDLWRQAFPAGTEWHNIDRLYEFNWDFSNLEKAFEEGGVLHGKKVFLFVNSESVNYPIVGDSSYTILFPAVIAVVSPFPPSDQIGITSIQRTSEEIIHMKRMKMDWIPYIPLKNRESGVDRLKSQIFILSCTQRKSAVKHLTIDRVKKFEYSLPCFYNPLKEDTFEEVTDVQIMFTTDQNDLIQCSFSMEADQFGDFVDTVAEEEELSEDQKNAFRHYARERIREVKRENREAKEERRRALENMDEETRLAYERMKVYKFYPVQTPDTPDISGFRNNKFINRYYGNAHEVL